MFCSFLPFFFNLLFYMLKERRVGLFSFLGSHKNSPNWASKVPCCKLLSFKVNRGPSSWILAFFAESKMYLHRPSPVTLHIRGWWLQRRIRTYDDGRRWSLADYGTWRRVFPWTQVAEETSKQTCDQLCVPIECWSCLKSFRACALSGLRDRGFRGEAGR
jgi:hypothetical protein